MKKHRIIFFTVLLLSLGQFSMAQTADCQKQNYSASMKKVCNKNTTTDKYDCGDESATSCLFEFNCPETMIKHTTATISSTYYISEKNRFDEADSHGYRYELKSDVGNKYTLFIPDSKEYLLFLGTTDNKKFYIKYTIKNSWAD